MIWKEKSRGNNLVSCGNDLLTCGNEIKKVIGKLRNPGRDIQLFSYDFF